MWIKERTPMNADVHATLPGAAPEEARLRAWVERLAIPRHISANARNNAWVRDELIAAFEGYGLSVQLQGWYQNVVALPRSTAGRPVTLITAHYDSIPDCPGADDNASGLAVMLECARILARSAPGLPVGFVAFNAEEDEMLGSHDFVIDGLPALDLQVRATHVLEMVGFRHRAEIQHLPLPWAPASLLIPDFIGLVAKGRSNAMADRAVAASAAPGLRVLAMKTWGPLHRFLPDLTRSDHFPFWSAGLPAVLWTDTANFRNPHYHRPTDTPDTLDYAFMREVAELLCAVVSQEAAR
jgi:Zn-dependent M28 family amino/carboxypeptidase